MQNSQFRRFPNENFSKRQVLATNKAEAFYVTAQQRRYPWTGFAEAFSIDADYTTRAFIPNSEGEVFYDNEQQSVYEFVDDNDDQDELPDWTRRYLGPRVNTRQGRGLLTDNAVFPGIDENNDDLSDFNRNFNREPDYAEPFLRYDVDPPEFLFGMDMNNNTVIDRFEDDTQADYPYKVGHRVYNAYVGLAVAPGTDIMVGRLDERLLQTARDSSSNYLLLTTEKKLLRKSLRLLLIANPRKVKDDIPDDVFLWVDTPGTLGEARFTDDPLAAQDAFVNTTYFDLRYERHFSFITKFKHDWYRQLGARKDAQRNQRFIGIINKGERAFELQSWRLRPRWKQLYSNRVPADRSALKTEELTEIFSLQMARNIVRNMSFTAGAEFELFNNLRKTPASIPQGFREDGTTLILAGQIANNSAYQGYALTTNVGVRWIRENFDSSPSSVRLFSFISIFAGLGTDR